MKVKMKCVSSDQFYDRSKGLTKDIKKNPRMVLSFCFRVNLVCVILLSLSSVFVAANVCDKGGYNLYSKVFCSF